MTASFRSVLRHRPSASIVLLLLACQSCASLNTYAVDRVRDISDIVDARYGTGFGLGIQAQFAHFQSGLGCSVEWYQRQWFGRKSVEIRDGLFAHGIIFGVDGDYVRRLAPGQWDRPGSTSTGNMSVLILNTNTGDEPWTPEREWFEEPAGDYAGVDSGRFGGAVFLPGALVGLYLNIGELADFCCGLVGYDIAKDDGYPKFFTPDAAGSASPQPH